MSISDSINFFNNIIWSTAMLILLVGTGLFFTIKLHFFQFTRHFDMWKNIIGGGVSKSGISAFSSFCTTMAMRIGTGNVAGVAVAIYKGGPGALFWMWVVGMTNSAISFVECTLGQLYKQKFDGEYRGSSALCAEHGLGMRWFAVILSLSLGIGAALFMPAAATYTITDAFYNATGVSKVIYSVVIAILFLLIVSGGIRRIGKFTSYVVPIMTLIYLSMAIIITLVNIREIPRVFLMIMNGAWGKDSMVGGAIGSAIINGVKRGTFSSASGMGEAIPAASASETTHPIKQGLANAAGVWLDTMVICTCTGFMILVTNCFNTEYGYLGSDLVKGAEGGVIYVQAACRSVVGNGSPMFIAIILFLFSFTCIVSYYYEAETSLLYLTKNNFVMRKVLKVVLKLVMTTLVFIYGIVESGMAWDLSDLALGSVTWINMIMILLLSPKVFILYKDYVEQKKKGINPIYNPRKENWRWKGVDIELWENVNNL